MIKKNFSLQKYNTFGFDIKADYFVEFKSVDELKSLNFDFKKNKFFILGGGSNLLFTKDFNGLVIKSINNEINIIGETDNYIYLKVGAGYIWDDFVKYCVDNNYGGCENLSLIPGTVGASAIQNIGAYGVEAKDIISKVFVYDLVNHTQKIFKNDYCLFNYRYSIFKRFENKSLLVTDVEFKLTKNNHNYNTDYGAVKQKISGKEVNLQNIRQAIIEIRQSKLPDVDKIGNAGSFFKNPVIEQNKFNELKEKFTDIIFYELPDNKYKLAAGWLIEQCGFKGFKYKNAGVYDKQALVLINRGNATPNEIIELSDKIIETILQKYSIKLESEVIFI